MPEIMKLGASDVFYTCETAICSSLSKFTFEIPAFAAIFTFSSMRGPIAAYISYLSSQPLSVILLG